MTVLDDDIVAVERRRDVRIIVNIGGRYQLSSRYDANGNRREFACRALNLSAHAVLLAAPVVGTVGDRVTAHIDHIGKLTGAVVRVMDKSFVMSIEAGEDEREWLESKLIWFDRYKNHDVNDLREHERVVPKSPHSRLILPDGRVMTCLVIDMSPSGAALSADVELEHGTVVAVGTVVGRVVRRFAEGFAIQFREIQDAKTLEARVIRC